MPGKNDILTIAAGEDQPALAPYKGGWSSNEVTHLLKRCLFGAKKETVNTFLQKTPAQCVELLLDVDTTIRAYPINDYDTLANTHVVPFGKTWVNSPYLSEDDDDQRGGSMTKWIMGNLVMQDTTLLEKMVLFWHNHFATDTAMRKWNIIWNHYLLVRNHALGNIRELTKQMTIDPHMLRFLNGELNTKLAPNENYARELQELFCIGKGPNAKFTEEDVKQAAKVLTGWKLDPVTNKSYFVAADHDSSDKTFSSFYRSYIIKGRSGADAGLQELDELLAMLFDNPETASFICRKIYRWFVDAEIDAVVEKNIIAPLANTLRKNNYEIKPVLRLLLNSDHFYSNAIKGSKVKSPVDFCIGFFREFDIAFAGPEQFLINNSMLDLISQYTMLLGQIYTNPPSVSGWPAFYQAPAFDKLWINTSTYPKRNEFSSTLIDYGFNREGYFFWVDVVRFARSLKNPGDPGQLINESLELLYAVPVSTGSKAMLKKNFLLSGQEQDHYWTDAWNDHVAAPADEQKKGIVERRLKALYRYLVNSPEYQLF